MPVVEDASGRDLGFSFFFGFYFGAFLSAVVLPQLLDFLEGIIPSILEIIGVVRCFIKGEDVRIFFLVARNTFAFAVASGDSKTVAPLLVTMAGKQSVMLAMAISHSYIAV